MEDEIQGKTYDIIEILSDYITNNNIDNFRDSPKKSRYRNNILYSIGKNDENDIEIGPLQKSRLVKNYSYNLTSCELANDICEYVKCWVTSFSRLKVIDYETFTGFWRHINIRNNLNNEFIIILRFNNYEQYHNIWEKEVTYFIEYIKYNSCKKGYKMVGLYYQKCIGKREPRVDDPIYTNFNDKDLIEEILGIKFIISPLAFFQVNTYTGKMIFEIVRNIIKKDDKGILLDLCCGMGVYSLILADYFKKTIGIDNSLKNISCASDNIILNNKANCSFYCDRVENIIDNILDLYKDEKIYIVLNPPRRGVYKEVIEEINKNIDRIEQIIYVSCFSPTLKNDLNLLNLKEKEVRKIIPINQFPHTEHYEIIVDIN